MYTRIVSIAVGSYAVYDVAKRHSYTVVLDDDNKLIRSSLWVSIFELCFLCLLGQWEAYLEGEKLS